ncbi:unnamed protein product [Heterobilharzia americana]|nr:unnamed protein product [Heterobilharzia americana]
MLYSITIGYIITRYKQHTAVRFTRSLHWQITELWINLNTKAISSRLSAKQLHQNVKLLSQRIQFVYSTTYNWCNFCLRQPSAQEIHNYWRSAFPWCFHLLCYIFITVFRYKNNNFQSSYMSNSLITTSVAMTHPWLIFGVFRQLKKIIAYVYHKIRDQYRQNYFRYASPTILETDHGFYLIRT